MVSSMSAGAIASGTMPAWASSCLRRGLSLASTSATGLLEAIGDASLGEVIRSHLHHDLVSGQHADAVLAHLAGGVRDDLVAVLEQNAEMRIGQALADRTLKFQQVFFSHSSSWRCNGPGTLHRNGPKSSFWGVWGPPNHNETTLPSSPGLSRRPI